MFLLALFLGIYTHILFFVGIFGKLSKEVVIIITLLVFLIFLYLQRNKWPRFRKSIVIQKKENYIVLLILCLIIFQVFINVLGALGPELGFDALWYHLTLPKLYLQNHSIYHIPGGLLYYSDMPKLGEMLYVGALSFGDEITAKLLHFIFGILSCAALYLFCRKYFTKFISLIAVVVFYSSLVVAWESTTAYVDLIRTFFEILALWSFINWTETKNKKWFYTSALMVGLAITTKLLAFGSLVIFLFLIAFWYIWGNNEKTKFKNLLIGLIVYTLTAILIPLPWLLFAYVHTGNPFYPFFSDLYKIAPEPFSITNFFLEIWNVFVHASDPISPLFIMLLPLVIFFFSRLNKQLKLIAVYSALAIIIWYFTPRTGGGRFLLPYLPAFAVLCAAVFSELQIMKRYILVVIIFTTMLSIGYRTLAIKKFIPVIFGQQTKDEFLKNNLNFSYGDFYDTDNYFKNTIKSTDRVLLYGFHNLYYVAFPFVDSSWVKKGDTFNYIAVQNGSLPERFKDWQLVHSVDKTMVKIYRQKGSQMTSY